MAVTGFGCRGEYEPAMSWKDIGAAMGLTRQEVFYVYQRAVKKLLAQHPGVLRRLAELARERQRLADTRTVDGEEWAG